MLKLTVRFDGDSATMFSPVEKMIVDALIHIKADVELYEWQRSVGGPAFASAAMKLEHAREDLPLLQQWVDGRFGSGVVVSVTDDDETATPQ